ncbi:MAG: response regulator [Pirellulaceae bacterium]|nr:response regulator [Planctomycetales bacterium]
MSSKFENLNPSYQSSTTTTIVVVDDEAYVRDLISRWLAGAGYRVLTARNAEQAWRLLQVEDVQLVASDVRMNGASGIDLLRNITATKPDIAVVMLTAVSDVTTAVATLTHGASGYLTKPIEREELLVQVHHALERRRLRLENDEYMRTLERKVREQTVAIRRAHEETILRLLNASRYRDEETGAHVRRTGLYSEVLSAALGWPEEQVEYIRMAAPMHDVGKIGIPDAILRKPGKLTADEIAIMRTHTQIGAGMLAGSETPVLGLAYEIALNHHEHWDGNGYPRGIAGTDIPEAARIVSIVDVYDALSHDRIYRPAMPEKKVLSMLREGIGSQFEPRIGEAFFDCLDQMRHISRDNPDESPAERSINTCWNLLETTEEQFVLAMAGT